MTTDVLQLLMCKLRALFQPLSSSESKFWEVTVHRNFEQIEARMVQPSSYFQKVN